MRQKPDSPLTKVFSTMIVILIMASMLIGAVGLFVKVTEWTGVVIKNAVFKEEAYHD